MKTASILRVTALLAATLALRVPAQPIAGLEDLPWQKLRDDDGITTYRAEVPGSSLFAFRAVALIPEPIAKVAGVLVDAPRRTEWMPQLRFSRVIRQLSPLARIEHSRFHTPIFVAERDFVVHGTAEVDAKTKTLLFRFKSVEGDDVPEEPDAVRGAMLASGYRLSAVPGGTEVDYWAHIDPRGHIAKWIVNAFAKSFPRQMMVSLRTQAMRDDVKESAELKRLLH